MTVQYLLTSVNKTRNEIISLLESLNIHGNILVGNQLMNNDLEYEIKTDKYIAKVFDMTSKGVSKNRNFLTLKSTADYITYLDDDMYFEVGAQEKLEKILEKNKYDAVRFNVLSDNSSRPIKLLSKQGYVCFRHLSSFGVWGIFYKRQFLIDFNVFFRENIGPGTEINHGEDSLFNKTFLKKSKIYSVPLLAFHAKQSMSTWQGENRNLELEMFSHGYVYQLLYPKSSKLMARLFISTHMHCYPRGTKKSFLKERMFKGIEAARKKEYRRGAYNANS